MYNRGEIMSEIERQTIYNWVINTLWSKLETITFNRLHYFLNRNDSSILPLIWEIKERIVNKESMGGFQQEPTLKDFLAVIPKTAYIQKHTDRNIKELVHIRFNVFISSPKMGFKTYYGGNEVDTQECCYVLSRSGIDEHYTEINEDDIPRISLSFGYLVPFEKVDELTADKSIGTYTFYPLALPTK